MLRGRLAEEVDFEKCNFCKFRSHDLHLDLGLRQGHISMHNTYRTTSILDHVTLASSNTDLEKCNFRNFRRSVTLILTLDRVEVIICSRGLPTHQIRSKSDKLFVAGWTDRPEFQFVKSLLCDDPKTRSSSCVIIQCSCSARYLK